MGIKGKTILKVATGIGAVLASGAGLFLAKKSGQLDEDDKDMLRLDPIGDDDLFCEECEKVEAEEIEQEEETEEEVSED